MIVLSAGMQRSGTGWYFNLTNALVVATGGDDAADLKTGSRAMQRRIREPNSSIGGANLRHMLPLVPMHLKGHRFTVKTHGPPSIGVRGLIAAHVVRPTYQYRDPRDIVVSILAFAQKPGTQSRMAKVSGLEEACQFTSSLFPTWKKWTSVPGVLVVTYEQLQADLRGQLVRLAEHLGLEASPAVIDDLVERYPAGTTSASTTTETGLHFNKGGAGGFAEQLTPEQLAVCDRLLGPQLTEMGYSRSAEG